ncbi:VWA domain-containing protein [Peteryoungia desertarenae]|uniref:VWA domain-containing protein n=1 Tax=Peteryoungia desertarenae TaxID=1813451 RepID=A0ABX6QQW9_9HYPH|nr:VWA domain-containing protein [Peteryoungia desertarenae]QLF70657.1 VWA domain-containing protein [Peteryoungia desertarenae]
MQLAGGNDGIVVPPIAAGDGRFADNILYFARVLRKAGLKPGPGAVVDAIEAVDALGIGSRVEFHAALGAIFVKRHEDQPVFDEAFEVFWQSRDLVGKMIQLMSPRSPDRSETQKPKAGQSRVSDALMGQNQRPEREERETEVEVDARLTMSPGEVFRRMDFGQMSARELSVARREIERLRLPVDTVKTRRYQPTPRGRRIDPRASMRHSLRTGGDLMLPRVREVRVQAPPLVVLADISGSMSQYSRIFLHFLHVLSERRRRVHVFLFGTRLTNVTRQLRHRDPDEAIARCTEAVADWSGGTRIGETLRVFNRQWGRRVLGQGAVVLLITDGLEREDIDLLETETDRLHRSCRRLIWLNPLLRFEGFEPRARGVRAMLPHVDELRSVHNLQALGDLVAALSAPVSRASDPRRFLLDERAS